MYIVDRHTDFYDHLSHVYGLDKAIVFDRRGSVRLTNEIVAGLALQKYERDDQGFLLLEAGNTQHILHLTNIETHNHIPTGAFTVTLFHTYNEHRHLFDALMSIRGVRLYSRYYSFGHIPKKKADIELPSLDTLLRRGMTREAVDLPILADTKLTSVLDAHQLWVALQTYISSLDNDKDVSIPMTDSDKATIHGFDKYSFRHPTK